MSNIYLILNNNRKVPLQMGKTWPKHTPERGEYMKIKKGKGFVGHKIEEEVCSLFSAGLESLRRRKRNIASSNLGSILSSFSKYSLL